MIKYNVNELDLTVRKDLRILKCIHKLPLSVFSVIAETPKYPNCLQKCKMSVLNVLN